MVPTKLEPIRTGAAAVLAAFALTLSACSSTIGTADATATSDGQAAASGETTETSGSTDLFDPAVVHDIQVTFDEDAYDDLIATFVSTGEKIWIPASVTLDGVTYDDVGIRLKGNSSLFGLTADTAANPEDLPWLIRLNEYVDGQDHQGYEEIAIRSSSTETAINEAVALDLLDRAGLEAQQAMSTTFTVNGGETELRLAVEHPDEEWMESAFGDDDGALYKADSEGDYSYRGDDPDAYIDVFDQKAGDDDLTPVIEFVEFINTADDETFAAELSDWLDVDAFATYLAFQDLIGNADDINGRGNNSYLYYDEATERLTVVAWDHNLAFDTANVGGGGGAGIAGAGGGERPERPGGAGGPAGGGGPGDQPNVLVDRFMADGDLASLYDAALGELTAELFTSGAANDAIQARVGVLYEYAGDLVTDEVITAEASAVQLFVDGVTTSSETAGR